MRFVLSLFSLSLFNVTHKSLVGDWDLAAGITVSANDRVVMDQPIFLARTLSL